jgi:hypothetical protein
MPRVTCPNGHRLQVSDRHLGQTIQCPTCQSTFLAEASPDGFDFEENKGEDKGGAARGGKGKLGGFSILTLVNNFVGKPLLFFGLLFVVLGRGCDATSLRSVARSDAQYSQAKVAFRLDWSSKLSAVQQKIDKKKREIADHLDTTEKRDEDFNKRLNELQKDKRSLDKELNKLQQDQSSAQSEKENGAWKPLREAAMKAATNHRMTIYWYEWLFIFGTVVLVLGVLTLAFTGQGPERWVAYIMIAIITFSIYVGGAAWIGSIVSSSGGGPTSPIEREVGPGFPK